MKNKNNNYFTQQIQKYGKEFLSMKNPDIIEREAPRIFRELAQGKINLTTYGYHFLDSQFLHSLIKAASEQFTINNISFKGVELLIYQSNMNMQRVEQSVIDVYMMYKRRVEAYDIILRGLNALKISKDLNYLVLVVQKLQEYKYAL